MIYLPAGRLANSKNPRESVRVSFRIILPSLFILISLIFQPNMPFSPAFQYPLPFISFILYPEIVPVSFSDGGFTVTEALSLILPF
jgi:hypothetical protein